MIMSDVVFDNIPCPCIFRELNRNLTAQLFLNFKDFDCIVSTCGTMVGRFQLLHFKVYRIYRLDYSMR